MSITEGVQDAHDTVAKLLALGVPVNDIVDRQLPDEGVQAFAESFDAVVESVGTKLSQFAH